MQISKLQLLCERLCEENKQTVDTHETSILVNRITTVSSKIVVTSNNNLIEFDVCRIFDVLMHFEHILLRLPESNTACINAT